MLITDARFILFVLLVLCFLGVEYKKRVLVTVCTMYMEVPITRMGRLKRSSRY